MLREPLCHTHPCVFCGQHYACDAPMERNHDGWPDPVCVTRTEPNLDHQACTGCREHGAVCANPACGKSFTKTKQSQRFCCGRCVSVVTVKLAQTAAQRPLLQRFMEKFDKVENGCWEWRTRAGTNHYGSISVEGGKQEHAHRVSWILHNGSIPHGMFVLHTCDNRPCVNPEHLFLGTNADNVHDMVVKGRARCVLTADQARAIYADPRIARVIASEFGVSKSLVRNIKARLAWKHATEAAWARS